MSNIFYLFIISTQNRYIKILINEFICVFWASLLQLNEIMNQCKMRRSNKYKWFFLLSLVAVVLIISKKEKVHSLSSGSLRSVASCMDGGFEYSSLAPPPTPQIKKINTNSDAGSFVELEEGFDLKKLNEWLPEQITPDENGARVMHKIADRGVQSFFSSANFKNSRLGRLNEKIKEETKMEVQIKNNGHLEHRISANVEPFQQKAKLAYNGFVGLELSYYMADNTQAIKLVDRIFNKKVYYENNVNSTERNDHLGVQWDW